MDVAALRLDLLTWYHKHARDLPWRKNLDPYRIWISEVMLQQTQVETVRPYFERWMAAFPTVHALARASEDVVMGLWSGLGYYSRARNLHKAAKLIDAAGAFPQTAQDLVALPGIGAYTSGAIASIAFQEAVPAVDGNVVRVAARLTAEQGDPRQPGIRRRIDRLAKDWVDPRQPGDWNQALMDLGATICKPQPRCHECPIQRHCQAQSLGLAETIPPPKRAQVVPTEERVHARIEQGGRVLLVRRPDTGLLARTWMLPGGELSLPLEDHIRDQTGLQVRVDEAFGTVEHRFTHRHWQIQVHDATVLAGELSGDCKWVDKAELGRLGLSTAAKKALAAKPM